jgi:hypothetical protein
VAILNVGDEMKPDWKNAPEWANYLGQDGSGTWYWYKCEPEPELELDYNPEPEPELDYTEGCFVFYDENVIWHETLEKRP